MIELSNTMAPETVTITALIKVTREVTIDAYGKGHAKEIARSQARASQDSHEWTCPDGTKTTVAREHVERIL